MKRWLMVLPLLLVAGAAQEARVVGDNLVQNGDFAAGREGWGSGHLKVVDDPVEAGNPVGMLDNRDAAEKQVWAVQNFIPIQPRTTYRLSLKLRRLNGEGYLYTHCNWYREPGQRLMISETWAAPRAIPITSRTGETVGRWQTLTGELRSDRVDCGGIQLVILLRGNDQVWFDDIKLERLDLPDAPAWQLPDAVVFPGAPSAYHMAVDDVQATPEAVRVTTAGAAYRLTSAGELSCSQRIGAEREVASVKFAAPLGRLTVAHQDDDVCVVTAPDVAFGFQGDSLVTVATNKDLDYTVTSRLGAAWFQRQDPFLLAIDEQGGFSVMPYARPGLETGGTQLTMAQQDTTQPGWTADYRTAARAMTSFAVFPGKPFDWEASFEKRIVNTADCPEPEALRAYAEHATVLFLFGGVYEDHPGGYTHAPYRIKEPDKLRKTIALAHELGMQVIVYRHPESYSWAEVPLDEGLADMERQRAEYGWDGWYLDGYPAWSDWYETYRAMRFLRQAVGEAVIYTHCTLNPPVSMTTLYCPFIDSYSDFLLRGEGQAIPGPDSAYMRYVINTQQISNSFATLKGDKMLAAPESEAKVPLKDQLAAMLKLNGRCRWAYPKYPFGPVAEDPYLGFYFPELDRMEADWRRTGEPLPMRWP